MPITKNGSFTDFDSESVSEDSDGFLSTSNSNRGGDTDNSSARGSTDDVLGLKKSEGCAIRTSRVLFFSFLIIAAGFLGWVVYRTARSDEVEDFETTFQSNAKELYVGSENAIRQSMGALNTLAAGMIAFSKYELEHGNDQEPKYPPGFITLPNVEHQFSTVRETTGSLIIAYAPKVENDALEKWNEYSEAQQGWIAKSNGGGDISTEPIYPTIWKDENEEVGDDDGHRHQFRKLTAGNGGVSTPLQGKIQRHRRNQDGNEEVLRIPVSPDEAPFAPVWTISPPPPPEDTDVVNYNLLERPVFQTAVDLIALNRHATFLDVGNQAEWFGNHSYADELQTVIAHPVFDDFNGKGDIVGHLASVVPWRVLFSDILHGDAITPITIVMENSCGEVFTLEVTNEDATIVDPEKDTHDPYYDYLRMSQPFADFANPEQLSNDVEHCVYTINAYPTAEFEDYYLTKAPGFYTLLVLCVMLSTTLFFLVFDFLVQRRQGKVVAMAMKQNAIVSSLFPKNIQAKMLEEVDHETSRLSSIGKAGIKSYLRDAATGVSAGTSGSEKVNKMDKSKPIADLFPEVTILFADIAGFTAWSSTREPTMVFTLLETVYHFFDATAKRRRVFKVEVVGDCYVACCGLPDPRKDHAVVMAKFAHECLKGMSNLTNELEVELGPDTTDLGLRVGLHSGPVVAGVLRGEKSRFQLFGDTMNTASRMESTGMPGRIQISQETTDLLLAAGKSKWVYPREDKVTAKGKGKLSTYWLDPGGGGDPHRGSGTRSVCSRSVSSSDNMSVDSGKTGDFVSLEDFQLREAEESTNNRIASWTVEVLSCLLKEIEARRRANKVKKEHVKVSADTFDMRNIDFANMESMHKQQMQQNKKDSSEFWEKKLRKKQKKKGATVIDEVEEIIMLPSYDANVAKKEKKEGGIQLSKAVSNELRDYVQTVASMYNNNPFHNFSHANHVTMSVTKLLSRIVAPDVENFEDGVNTKSLHDHTYGITSDPLTRFAVVLSALIHDVDHDGVSNMQLVKEKTEASKLYKGKSVAEQNSVDLAWNLLMEPTYKNLRKQIYSTEEEFNRFRQLVVNTVMATDIMDKDLKKLRNDRWDKAFSIPPEEEKKDPRAVNRKATIVIEHLIQASDVSHTMQHWHIYRKWNERLFQEMYKAYEEGRMEKDPSVDWYKGEIGFFDFYIIPLAKKLADCGVFGVSSKEYLIYAQQNRKEWENRGEEVVAEMIANMKRKNVGDIVYSIQQDCVDPEGQKFVKEVLDIQRRASMHTSSHGTKPVISDLPLEITTGHDKGGTDNDCYSADGLDDDNVNSFGDLDDDTSSLQEDIQVPIKG